MIALTCHKCGRKWDYGGNAALYATCPSCHANVRIPGKYATLLAWHQEHSLKVLAYGSGHSYVVVPDGEDLGGHLETVLRLATVPGWVPIKEPGRTLVPTYAYDRVVVAGLGCRIDTEESS